MKALQNKEETNGFCKFRINVIKDSMGLLTGKWKIHILGTLLYGGKMRFTDLQREIGAIGPKMLSKELQDLEINHLLTRTVLNTKPITVEYDLTDFGKTLEPIIDAITQWGIDYRETLFGKRPEN
ncbi:winged helix-turn-helix transcriptional regulator [Chryseobacterium kwangjuense]|uniref:HxlR family transcriptional regulator n=1 Tax=Chryseobacterium kwangjuense TaxID=267125 RepID=A0A135WFI2_9FLAO|nr:helix-turn-helix domain-containing protein [Chryseobacterium kwangjuense]KXH83512.1 HxlR family transcriptional regulator [Chryseobacterium kwangjuense]